MTEGRPKPSLTLAHFLLFTSDNTNRPQARFLNGSKIPLWGGTLVTEVTRGARGVFILKTKLKCENKTKKRGLYSTYQGTNEYEGTNICTLLSNQYCN